MTRARGRGRGVTRGRSLSQPGRGVRGGVRGNIRTPVRDRRSTGLVQRSRGEIGGILLGQQSKWAMRNRIMRGSKCFLLIGFIQKIQA